jgi:hypothetical protein
MVTFLKTNNSLASHDVWTHEDVRDGYVWQYYFAVCHSLGAGPSTPDSATIPRGCDLDGGGCLTKRRVGVLTEQVVIPSFGKLINS